MQVRICRRGYRSLLLRGLCGFPAGCGKSVEEMKREVSGFIRGRLSEGDPAFREFSVEISVFRELGTDFMYFPSV